MLRKAFAGLLSALLIGAVALVPSAFAIGHQIIPTGANFVAGNYLALGTTAAQWATVGNPAGNSGGNWWGYFAGTYVAQNSGTVTNLEEYADCGTAGPNGGVCSTNTASLTLWINGTQSGTCSFTYPGTTNQWFGCDISAVSITKGQTITIAETVSAAAQADHFGVATDVGSGGGSTFPGGGLDLACGQAAATPATFPPTNPYTTSSTGCSGAGNGQITATPAFAAVGTSIVDLNSPSIGNTAVGAHTTSIATHKAILYKFSAVPNGGFVAPIQFLTFFADSTTSATLGWQGGIYTDNAGTPGTLVAECNEASPGSSNGIRAITKNQWNDCTLGSVQFNNPFQFEAGQVYWLAIWNADGTNSIVIDDQSTTDSSGCLIAAAQTTGLQSTFVTTGDALCGSNPYGQYGAAYAQPSN